jgi:transcriptional regulator of arginine metabolism
MNKTERLELIKKIISEQVISNQDELQLRLKDLGCEVTQATLSRDLKTLQVMKVNDGKKGYAYRLASPENSKVSVERTGENFLTNTVLGIEFSANLGVLKTLPGYASSVAILIDKFNASEILGTVAGDDTILLIIREGINHSGAVEVLKMILPGLEYKI